MLFDCRAPHLRNSFKEGGEGNGVPGFCRLEPARRLGDSAAGGPFQSGKRLRRALGKESKKMLREEVKNSAR